MEIKVKEKRVVILLKYLIDNGVNLEEISG